MRLEVCSADCAHKNVVCRKHPRPRTPQPPGPEATIDCQLAYERVHTVFLEEMRVWKVKQYSALNLITRSCEGDARELVKEQKHGQIVYLVLQENYQTSDNEDGL